MKAASLLLCAATLLLSAPPRRVIIDTDAGSDDLMAIAFLLARADLDIEAITVVNGLAHVPEGAKHVLQLLELAGRTTIPVYEGRLAPLEGTNEFPESWRVIADALPGVDLPETTRKPEPDGAAAFLRTRLANARQPVSILALGPLTNIAEVLAAAPQSVAGIEDLVVMGGAVRVAGNLGSGGLPYAENRMAEWNIYVDPAAAQKVFDSVLKCRLIPLDASNAVPLDLGFLIQMQKTAKSKLGRFAAQVLASNRALMEQGMFYAWDPLAAAALVNPSVVKLSSVPLTVTRKAPQEGRTAESPTARPVRVALTADPVLFRKTFMDALR